MVLQLKNQKTKSEMEDQLLKKQQEEIDKINLHLKSRAEKFGSQFVPISLSDYKLYKIKKASQTGKMEYLESILLEDIQDLQQRKKIIKERTEKFFPNVKVESNTDKYFNNRQNPDFTEETTQLRFKDWYLFGVDYMSNERLRNYFSINPHFRIQWINDSSCNICFNSKQEADQAIKPYIKGDQLKNEKDQIWYQLKEYEVEGVKRKLFCRLATSKDVKPEGSHGHNSKYYHWQINKKKINNFVKKRATQFINKQKKIKKENVKKQVAKKEQEQDSSSVIDSDNDNVIPEAKS